MSEFILYFGIFAAIAGAAYALYHFFIKKEAWADTQADSPIDVPKKLPNVSYSAKGVKVYCSALISRDQYVAIDEEIQRIIDITNGNIPQFVPNDAATKWKRFKKHSEFNILILPPTYRSQSPDYPGCPLLTMKSGLTVAGTVIGYRLKNGRIYAEQPFIVVPMPDSSDRCMQLWRAGIFNESQHYVLINDTQLFRWFSGANDIHPLFTGEAVVHGFKPNVPDEFKCGFEV